MSVQAPPSRASAPPGIAPPRRRRRDNRVAFWLLTPSMLVLALIIGYPVISAGIRSFYGDGISSDQPFVGFHNYALALWGTNSATFWSSVGVTALFAAVTVTAETLIGLGMAVVMNRAFRGRGVLRASVLVPWAIPTAVTAVLWKWSFDPAGIINALTGSHVVWTGSEWPSRIAIMIADVWKTAPFVALLILAGLQVIPEDVYTAARVDGAGTWQRFRLITLPLVRPAILVAVLFRLLDALRMYDLPQIFTNGANGTTTVSILVVRATLSELKPGYGGALSTLTFLLIFLVAYAFVRVFGVNAVGQAEERDA